MDRVESGSVTLNGYELAELREYVEKVRANPADAERNPIMTAHWLGGSSARVEGGGLAPLHIGGDGEPSAMRALLGALAACDVEVITKHATLMGLAVEDLSIEARGHFTVLRLLGMEGPGPGYDAIHYTVRMRAPGATLEQIERLRRICERGSPVGDSLSRPIPLELEFVVES